MVAIVEKYVCELCATVYDKRCDAERCESRGKEYGNFCYDLHTKEIFCKNVYPGGCAHLQQYGHIGKCNCPDFKPVKSGLRPEYYWG